MKLYRIAFQLVLRAERTGNSSDQHLGHLDLCVRALSVAQAIPRAEARAKALLVEGVEARVTNGWEIPGSVEEAERRLYSRDG